MIADEGAKLAAIVADASLGDGKEVVERVIGHRKGLIDFLGHSQGGFTDQVKQLVMGESVSKTGGDFTNVGKRLLDEGMAGLLVSCSCSCDEVLVHLTARRDLVDELVQLR